MTKCSILSPFGWASTLNHHNLSVCLILRSETNQLTSRKVLQAVTHHDWHLLAAANIITDK